MGVPAFFRWLCKKYPTIVVKCIEEKDCVDTSQTNPNGTEFDNLYLDLNCIIHQCTHPDGFKQIKTEDEMIVSIFEAIDRIFAIVRPRKLVYLAIDGVAPRAKLNQQRQRRFKAIRNEKEKETELNSIKQKILISGGILPPEIDKNLEKFDPNCITPGTPFMHKLSECLRFYIHDRLNKNSGWKNLIVILSDSNVPGEGEHKIVDFIRKQRSQPNHDPNTRHVLFGPDADLIMLGLATHEPHFTIIREEFLPFKLRPCEICNQIGHEFKKCTGLKQNQNDEASNALVSNEQNYIFLHLRILRDYLKRDLSSRNLIQIDFERSLDDWIFLCFLVGNDFLPSLPSLEIFENAIDLLVKIYIDMFKEFGGYLTNNGDVNFNLMKFILSSISGREDSIFKNRKKNEIEYKKRLKEKQKQIDEQQQAVEKLKNLNFSQILTNKIVDKENENEIVSEDEEDKNDPIKLWEDGWMNRYYKVKFNSNENDIEFRNKVALEYAKGLQWVMKYYYQGVQSWNWYYPFYYAPFANDFFEISESNFEFDKNTQPFSPFEQLMAVFPPESKKHLPQQWHFLMTERNSPIIDFYPSDFLIDLNGKKQSWQGIALLPSVDEKRLNETLQPMFGLLTSEQAKLNELHNKQLFVHKIHKLYEPLKKICNNKKSNENYENEWEIDTSLSRGIAGIVCCDEYSLLCENEIYETPLKNLTSNLKDTQVISLTYNDPIYDDSHKFSSEILKGAILPEATLKLKNSNHSNRRGGFRSNNSNSYRPGYNSYKRTNNDQN